MRNHTVRLVVALLVASLVPAIALAEDPPPSSAPPASADSGTPQPQPPAQAQAQAQAQARPQWSFGGGISYGLFGYGLGTTVDLYSSVVFLPALTASIERRVSPRSWFVLGLSGNATRTRRDIPDGSAGSGREDSRQLLMSAGVRRPLTRAAAPMEVSLVVLAQGGIFDGEERFDRRYTLSTLSSEAQDVTAWFAGAELGLAIDRELADGLTLRVASPLVDGRYERASARKAGSPDTRSSTVSVSAVLAPRLELRLLF